MKDLTELKAELRWCLEHGNRGPRTEAALLWALEALDEFDANLIAGEKNDDKEGVRV